MKKNIVFLITLLASLNLFAAEKPDFTCVEESGFMYQFYLTNYNEIHVFDEQGNELDHMDGLYSEVKFYETLPSRTVYKVFYDDGGQIAEVTFLGNENVGQGEMIDNDQKMTCIR